MLSESENRLWTFDVKVKFYRLRKFYDFDELRRIVRWWDADADGEPASNKLFPFFSMATQQENSTAAPQLLLVPVGGRAY